MDRCIGGMEVFGERSATISPRFAIRGNGEHPTPPHSDREGSTAIRRVMVVFLLSKELTHGKSSMAIFGLYDVTNSNNANFSIPTRAFCKRRTCLSIWKTFFPEGRQLIPMS